LFFDSGKWLPLAELVPDKMSLCNLPHVSKALKLRKGFLSSTYSLSLKVTFISSVITIERRNEKYYSIYSLLFLPRKTSITGGFVQPQKVTAS
jgi:hypothetical protein